MGNLYSNNINKVSVSLIRNCAAFAGLTVEGFANTIYTYYTMDPTMVEHLDYYYRGMMSGSRQLFETPDAANIRRTILEGICQTESSYSFCGLPVELVFDPEEWHAILEKNRLTMDQRECCMQYFDEFRHSLLDSLQKRPFFQMLDMHEVKRGIEQGIFYCGMNWMVGGNLTLSGEEFRAGLLRMIELLREYSNFYVGLVEENPFYYHDTYDISVLIKENEIAMINSTMAGTASPLIMKEPTIVHAFYQHFASFWETVPRLWRDKSNVISRLSGMLRS